METTLKQEAEETQAQRVVTELFKDEEMGTTPLGKECRTFVEIAQQISELKAKRTEQGKRILAAMAAEDRDEVNVTVGTESYHFEIKPGEDRLVCMKATRSPVPSSPGEQGGLELTDTPMLGSEDGEIPLPEDNQE